ncbi:hypothetical protein JAAARDRAFT_34037 [Jaapia argillacea MUCL 33604]|uniref:Uncharacterized protein n=1 Tax=Jaapia argillacea MUCL 33604 TaxID=933084 RepID=A0A067PWV5_9AGAM|nr:hypothetical protein JAAARDRAFT_34037 [Jaapia argillacea MUCL 33604]
MSGKEIALRLKDEGNALFAKKDFRAAEAKYTEAIRALADPDSNQLAVLYTNRAACSLNLKKYTEAADDAARATQIDPSYSKAWARFASALDGISRPSADHWQRALSTLPIENLTAAEMKQKEQYEAGLEAAKKRAPHSESSFIHVPNAQGKLPWDRALAMEAELRAAGPSMYASSAWVIKGAYSDFSDGVKTMKSVKRIKIHGQVGLAGTTNGLQDLTNGILRDSRVFHMDSADWIQCYNDQFNLEATKRDAFEVNLDAAELIQEALKRQRERGWDNVRPALSVTIRALIMRGFFDHIQNVEHSEKNLAKAIEILDWGRKAWKDIPVSEKGSIFEDTFVRGVRNLHLDVYMQAWQAAGTDGKYTLAALLEEADEIIRDVDLNPLPLDREYDPGFVSSFYIYPKARALAMKGFYHKQSARSVIADDGSEEVKIKAMKEHIRKAALYYLKAGSTYPDDDENHAWFLFCGVELLMRCGTPVKEVLPFFARIRLAVPKISRIWEHSSSAAEGVGKAFQRAQWMEEDILKAIAEGRFTLEDKLMPDENWS